MNGSTPCSSTMSAVRRGIINSTPSMPPQIAIIVIIINDGDSPPPCPAHMNSAGNVNIAPVASDSPAEPIVCTMLFSRIDFLRKIMRITPIDITAAGIDAETVRPTRRPKYAVAAPNTTARIMPRITDIAVNSGTTLSAGIYGLNFSFLLLIFFRPFYKIFPIFYHRTENFSIYICVDRENLLTILVGRDRLKLVGNDRPCWR